MLVAAVVFSLRRNQRMVAREQDQHPPTPAGVR